MALRGPARDLAGDYIACLGGSETYGKTVATPFPEILEEHTGLTCVNLGWPNAGVDVFQSDPALLRIASRAMVTVFQVPGAVNLTTRFYRVHPRRNDRVIAVREPLAKLYPEVDFTQFDFTRHLLARLREISAERFLQIQAELAAAWTDRMQKILARIEGPVVLFWFSDRLPAEEGDDPDLRYEPSLVTEDMLAAVAGGISSFVACPRGIDAEPRSAMRGIADLLLGRKGARLRRALPDTEAHLVAAKVLAPELARLLIE